MGLVRRLVDVFWERGTTVPVPRSPAVNGGFYGPVIREPYPGAWQRNEELRFDSVLANPAVFACTTLIVSDIAKCRLRLVYLDDGIWIETTSSAFSPVLKKPNRYQTIVQFLETWMYSKLLHGNTYVLKERDERGVVRALYVLDPARVRPLVTPGSDIYYELTRDDLSGINPDADGRPLVAPSSEIIHDRFNTLYHPLVGISPLYASAGAATQGLQIQSNSTRFFANGSQPGGVLSAPGHIAQDTADRLSEDWQAKFGGANAGRTAVLGDGLHYEPMTRTAVDSQLIEQLKWTTETVCSAFHVPASLIDSSHQPPYANSEPLLQQYYSQCLQTLMTALETSLDEGLELPSPYGTEFDIDDLLWFDTKTRTTAAAESIRGGTLSPNEARAKYFGLGKVVGGDSPYLQQQNFSLAALAERDANDPFSKPAAPVPAAPAVDTTPEDEDDVEKFLAVVHAKALDEGLYAS